MPVDTNCYSGVLEGAMLLAEDDPPEATRRICFVLVLNSQHSYVPRDPPHTPHPHPTLPPGMSDVGVRQYTLLEYRISCVCGGAAPDLIRYVPMRIR